MQGRGKNNKEVRKDNESGKERTSTRKAFREAEKDMESDPDLGLDDRNADLDEGESARLGEDKTDLV